MRATPSQALLRKLAYLATQDSDSVLAGALTSPRHASDSARAGKGDKMAETIQLLSMQEQIRQERIQGLNERLDALDRASFEALRKAEERLDEIRRAANRTKDGRLAFEGEDGKIYDEHGNEISPDEIDWEKWKPDGPKQSDFLDAQQNVDEAAQFRDRVQQQRARLDAGDLSDQDLSDLEAEIAALEVAEPGGTAVEQEQATSARSTSAAKQYADGDPALIGATLREPFAGAVIPAEADPAANSEPAVTPEPGAAFTPN